METPLGGIHHVTAITGDAQNNIDFYTGVLGLRMAKQSVNMDDPGTYHLYFGDAAGSPGTAMTFFAWSGLPKRTQSPDRRMAGETYSTAFSVPDGSLDYWRDRLESRDVPVVWQGERFGRRGLTLTDPDGLVLDLVEADDDTRAPWTNTVDGAHAIRGFHSVTLAEANPAASAAFLTGTLGFRQAGEDGDRLRFETGPGGTSAIVDIVPANEGRASYSRVGAVHHVAYRTADAATQDEWRLDLTNKRVGVTPVQDRFFFKSIYFREPGGVLYEIATDGPGFTIDEPLETLGSRLALPPWFEAHRAVIEGHLRPIVVPASNNTRLAETQPVA